MDAQLYLRWSDVLTNVVELLQERYALEVAWDARLHHVLAQKRHRVRIGDLIVAVRIDRLQQIIDFTL